VERRPEQTVDPVANTSPEAWGDWWWPYPHKKAVRPCSALRWWVFPGPNPLDSRYESDRPTLLVTTRRGLK
jgi:hypothetical protein